MGQGFLVRTDAGWVATSPRGDDPVPVDPADVLTAAGGGPPGSVDASRPVDEAPPGALSGFVPAWAIVAQVSSSGLVVEGPCGELTTLDATDIGLIERAGAPGGGDAPEPSDEHSERVQRLVELGVLCPGERTQEPVPGDLVPDGEPEAPAAASPSAPSAAPPPKLGRLRSALRRRRGTPGSVPSDDRTPVYSVWTEEVGPALSLGSVLAAAKAYRGGALEGSFDFHPMQTGDEFLARLRHDGRPSVLLCSNYLWSVEQNLDTARKAIEIDPDLVVIHGGPSTPAYESDVRSFLDEHGDVAHVLVHGEGEATLAEVLELLADAGRSRFLERLGEVPGVTYRSADGVIRRSADRERISDLGALPSPYLTGEFDHLPVEAWPHGLMHVETNRGCPYGCTFCDWGSATMARVRRFDVERVMAEARWGQRRGFTALNLCDANFGILPQDEVIAAALIDLRNATGFPAGLALTLAKNSTSRVLRVVEQFLNAGMPINSCISLQSIDPTTVAAVHRDNISIDVYLKLAATLRRWGYGLQSDMILGLPGQTLESFRGDLQFMFDHEIMPRTWAARLLPNSPMNEPGYREEHRIEPDELGVVRTTATLSAEDRAEAMRLRTVDTIFDRYGVLRHVLRLLQWDYGIPATEVEHTILRRTRAEPDRYPLLAWVVSYFDLYPTAPVGWSAFYDEVRTFVRDELDIVAGSDLETVLAVQRAIMPSTTREFPFVATLEHDYVTYYLEATRSLYTTGAPSTPQRPLLEYGPGTLDVLADPLEICRTGMLHGAPSRDEMFESDFHLGSMSANELMSPVMRILPVLSAMGPLVIDDRLERLGIDRAEWSHTSSSGHPAAGRAGDGPDEHLPSPVVLGRRTAG